MTTKIDPLATVPAHERLKVSLTWLASFANEIERKGSVEFASDLARGRALVFMRAALQAQVRLESRDQEIRGLRAQLKQAETTASQQSQQLGMRRAAPTTPNTADRLGALSDTLKETHETQAHSPAGPAGSDPLAHHPAADPQGQPAVGRHAQQPADDSWLFD